MNTLIYMQNSLTKSILFLHIQTKDAMIISIMHASVIFNVSYKNLLQVDLLRGQKTDRVDVTLQPEELDALDNVLPAK